MVATRETEENFNRTLDPAKAAGMEAELKTDVFEDDADATLVEIAVPSGRNNIHPGIHLEVVDRSS